MTKGTFEEQLIQLAIKKTKVTYESEFGDRKRNEFFELDEKAIRRRVKELYGTVRSDKFKLACYQSDS